MRRSYESERRRTVLNGSQTQKRLVVRCVRMPLILLLAILSLLPWAFSQGRDPSTLGSDWLLFGSVALLSVAAVFVLWTEAVRTSARVAGPERQIRNAIHQIREGELTHRVRLRKGDALHDLADELNSLLVWLESNPPQPRSAVTEPGDVRLEVG